MLVGIVELDIHIPFSQSLKQKRHVVKVLKNKLREKFNASVIESAYTDKWQRSLVTLALLRANRAILDSHLQRLINYVDNYPKIELLSWDLEVI